MNLACQHPSSQLQPAYGVAPLCVAVNTTLPPTGLCCLSGPAFSTVADSEWARGLALWAATLGYHLQAQKHFPSTGAEGPGLPAVDLLPRALDSRQQCVSSGYKPPDHSDPLPALGT